MIRHKDFLFVPTPVGARVDKIYRTHGQKRLGYWFKPDGIDEYGSVRLPPGSYSIVGLAAAVGEEVWEGIVDKISDVIYLNCPGYQDYESVNNVLQTATESGLSLLKSHGLDENSLILKID